MGFTTTTESRLVKLSTLLGQAQWLSVALEFQLGADIANTTIAPSLEALGKLAILAVIRTFLNVFLTRELEAEKDELKAASNLVLTPEARP